VDTSYHVMRSSIFGKPFCDTWWAVQCKTEKKNNIAENNKMKLELLFGTAIVLDNNNNNNNNSISNNSGDASGTTNDGYTKQTTPPPPTTTTTTTTATARIQQWIVYLLDPIHLLYSRLLLSNAKATLVLLQLQKEQQQQQQ
jgi:hypothetical protein